MQLLIFLLLISLSSCGSQNNKEEKENLIFSGKNSTLGWEIRYPDQDFYFSDRITMTLTLESFESGRLSLEAKENALWGDFRVYKSTWKSQNHLELLLQPRKTGDSILQFPRITLSDRGKYIEIPEVHFSILSSLNEDQKPMPLILAEESSPTSGFSLIIMALLSIILLLTGFFIYRKKRRLRKNSFIPSYGLPEFIEDQSPSIDQGIDPQLFYRQAFRYLLKDLKDLHPAVQSSDSPADLLNHLEMPSRLNQWALRSLYPLLEIMDQCFYQKGGDDILTSRYKEDLGTLTEWSRFSSDYRSGGDDVS
ncbi:hypothetical protein [Oceanispirochaeta sp.]|jgi:hypothetical protein|uniref:hypothetical protein n=1 Tax=Oceanispirochaeta sp. TaxID=2035350 RepID=UPI00260F1C19|nr:hypothetical protein [Oceanispirochaeta sp.]MDA3956766.1 hypothetical protein [Oceanispirochaeta sp.]